jgi:multidrug efflux system outer membrane protein
LSTWWNVFNDPLLSSLINRAEQNNLDLKIALARIREARAVVGVVDSDLYPVIDANGALSWGKESENVNPLATAEQTQYQLSAEAGWEIDLFGRIRRSIEAAAADYQATWEEHRDVLISVRAEVAEAYLQIRTLQAQLLTARDNIASQRSMLELTDIRYQNGLTSYLDVAQATQILAATEAELPLIRLQLAQAISRVGVLLGEPTDDLRRELQPARLVALPPQDLAVGIPADRIRQRPDVRSAERRLAAQTARIGVATADLYPSFSLSGTLGFSSLETGNFFDSGSQVYGLGPSFRWNIFDMGRIRQQISVEDARTEQALHLYEQSMLRAIKEVEDSLVGYHEQRLQFEALGRSVDASVQTLEMSTELYKDGLTSFQDVLDAQRSLFAAEKDLDAARGQTGIQLVGLYRALAGGWTMIHQDSQPSI